MDQPFQRLVRDKQLIAYKYEGYWSCMDTYKDRQQLEDLYTKGQAPWEVWKALKSEPDVAPQQELKSAVSEEQGTLENA